MIKINKIYDFEKIFLILFCTGSVMFFGFCYNNHIYQKEQLQLFEVTFRYLSDAISRHGGIAIYISEFFIQFFHLPITGAIIITLLLFLLQKLTKQVLVKVAGGSTLILFSFLPAVGYWIILLDDFYCLSGLTGLLISLAGALFYLNISDARIRGVIGIMLIPVVYWLAGAAYSVFVMIVIVAEIIFRFSSKEKTAPVYIPILLINILLAMAVPLAAREFLFRDTILQAFISAAYYRISIFFPIPLLLLFAFFPLSILLQKLTLLFVTEKQSASADLLSITILLLFLAWGIKNTGDFKAERQFAYENLVYKDQWDKIVNKAEKEKPTDRISLVAVNLALAKTGLLSSKMFQFDQKENSLFLTYERKGMTPFMASESFYHLGLINFAQMFAMETIESTPDAKYPVRSFKRVAETFIINGQYDIALKYLTPLSHTLFYRKWAKESVSLLHDEEKISAHPYWRLMRDLRSKYDFYYNEKQNDFALRCLLLSNPGNKMAFEYLMADYLLKKDFDGFLAYLPFADSLGYNELPSVWQEAAAYIGTRVSQMPPQLGKYTIDPDIFSRIRNYAQIFSTGRQDTVRMRKEFSNTYWYYLHYK